MQAQSQILPAMLYVLCLSLSMWLIITGIWHLSYRLSLRRERLRPGSGPTTNGLSAFRMTVAGIVRGFGSVTVSGSVKGILPVRGNVILLNREGKTIPLYLTGVKLVDMPEAESGVRVTLRLFGSRRAALQEGDLLTNVRAKRAAAPTAAPDLKPAFPVTVRRSRRDYLNACFPLALGSVCLLFFISLFNTSAGDTSDNAVIFVVLAAVIFLLGVFLLLDCLLFRLTLTEDGQVIISGPGKRTQMNIQNLSARVHLTQNNGERWVMDIFNAGNQRLATIDERCARFAEARKVFTDAQHRRGAERLYRLLGEGEFFVPVAVVHDAATGTEITMPAILTHKETGAPGIFLYDSEELINGRTPTVRRETMKVTLSHMVELMGGFSAGGEIVVFLSNPALPRSLSVNKDNWPQILPFTKQ